MQYIALIKQQGEGCDYTIGCGMKWLYLKAQYMLEARIEFENIVLDNYLDSDQILREAVILEVSNMVNYDMEELYARFKRDAEDELKKEKEEAEKKEFLRLKEKFKKNS